MGIKYQISQISEEFTPSIVSDTFVSLRNVSKEQGVYETLRHAITSGEMAAGQRLLFRQLAEQLGVSSMPVRNAMMRLAAEGLVTRIPHREYVVTAYSVKDITDLYALRAVLDGLAGRLAARNVTAETLQQLRGLVTRANELLAAGDIEAVRNVNRDFHLTLIRIADNQQLYEVLEMLQNRSQNYTGAYYAVPGIPKRAVDEHRRIVTALAQRKADLVENLLRRDMENTGKILAGLVDKHPPTNSKFGAKE